MTRAPLRPALILAATAALGLAADAVAAERQPVLEYVKPGARIVFVSATPRIEQEVVGWSFFLDRWTGVTPQRIQTAEAQGQRVMLVFEDGRVSGSGPCNSLSANYKLEGQSMSIDRISRSKKACPSPDATDLEEELVRFLESVTTMERVDNKLVLRDARGSAMTFWGAHNESLEGRDPDGGR